MAEIRKYPWLRHLRSEPTYHVLCYRRGKLVRSGTGLSFWFQPISNSISEIPVDTRELPYLVHGKSRDFQDVAVQGDLSYRVVEPEVLGEMVDFSIDLGTGLHLRQPLDQVASLLIGLCQQVAVRELMKGEVRSLLAAGPTVLKESLEAELLSSETVRGMGIEVLAVRVSAVSPSPELEKALQTPTREGLQQAADEAVFERRALAVEKERAIAENELQNRIELAKKEETLIAQEGANTRRRAEEEAVAQKIEVESRAESTRVGAEAQSESIRMVQGARAETESQRIGIYRDLSPAVIIGLAAQELAGKLQKIEHLNITPDILATGLNNLLQLGVTKLGDE